jgi:hypothetical protein
VKLTAAEVEVLSSSNTPWICDSCTRKKKLNRSLSDSCPVGVSPIKMSVSMEDIKLMLEEMRREILQGQTNLETELGKSLEHCSERIAENNRLIENQQKLLDEQQRAIACLQEENNRLRSQVRELSHRQTDLEQYSRRNTLEIFGVPEGPNETSEVLKKKVVDIGAALGANLSEDGIDACHRINGGSNRPTTGIIVKFLRRDDADNLIQKRKVKRDFSTRHLQGYQQDSPIYVNLSLAPARRILFAKARKLKSDFNYKYVWVDRAGRVKVRKSDDNTSRVIVVGNEEELTELVKKEATRQK